MRVSEVLSGSVETFLTLTPQIQDHLEGKENPHHVTKKQVGLGNVTDEKQATEEEFSAHTSSPVLGHPDGSVTTEKLQSGAVTAEKLAPGAVGGASVQKGGIETEHLSGVLQSKIEGKVDKEEGMGLSQNSFTDAEKAKLGAISVKDGAQLTMDTAALVMKTMPLKVRKTGTELVKTGEISRAPYNWFKELYSIVEDPETGGILIRGKNKQDTYEVYRVRPDLTGKRTIGTQQTALHYAFNGMDYFGQINSNGFLIYNFDGGTNPWKNFTVDGFDNTSLLDFFVCEDRVVVAYTSDRDGGKLHVESFTYEQEQEWKVAFNAAPQSQVQDTKIYDTRFHRVVMDGDDLYVAPVLSEDNPYGVLRLNRNGEITGRFMPITNFSVNEDVLVGLSKYGENLYGITPGGTLVRINTETSAVDTAKLEGMEGTALCNLTVIRGEKVLIHTENTEAGFTYIYQIDGKNMKPGIDLFPEKELDARLEETYVCSCYTQNGYEFFRCLEAEINSHVYHSADIYTVL